MRSGHSRESGTPVVEAFITNHKSFTLQCPGCQRIEDLKVSEISPTQPNPFDCQCPCGAHFMVRLVGFRTGQRKHVHLAASWVRASQSKHIRRLCAVLDLSFRGMRFTTDFTKELTVGDDISVSLVLDNRARNKLELPARVKRVTRSEAHLTVAVEFQAASNEHIDLLRRYTAT